jgi:hypothetical protein
MLDPLLLALQDSSFAHWVQSAAYPVVITLHSIGLAVLVGLLVIIDLSVLGLAPRMPLPGLRSFMTVVWIGFGVNALSGAMLFCIDAKKDFHSNLFRIKLAVIVLGLIFGMLIQAKLVDTRVSPRTKAWAVLSLLCWTGAIVSGRLLAYSTFGDVGVE